MRESKEIGGADHGVAQIAGIKTVIVAACLVVLGLPVSQRPEFIVFIRRRLYSSSSFSSPQRVAAAALVLLAG